MYKRGNTIVKQAIFLLFWYIILLASGCIRVNMYVTKSQADKEAQVWAWAVSKLGLDTHGIAQPLTVAVTGLGKGSYSHSGGARYDEGDWALLAHEYCHAILATYHVDALPEESACLNLQRLYISENDNKKLRHKISSSWKHD